LVQFGAEFGAHRQQSVAFVLIQFAAKSGTASDWPILALASFQALDGKWMVDRRGPGTL
jgi:hypothetical protein